MIAGRRKCDEEAAGVRGVSQPGEAQSSPVSPGKHCYRVGGIVVVVVVVVVEVVVLGVVRDRGERERKREREREIPPKEREREREREPPSNTAAAAVVIIVIVVVVAVVVVAIFVFFVTVVLPPLRRYVAVARSVKAQPRRKGVNSLPRLSRAACRESEMNGERKRQKERES